MKKYVYGGVLTFLFMGVVLVPNAQAETTTNVTSMLEQIKALMAKVEELQKQLSTIRGEIKEVIRAGVAEGMEGDDIKKIQELLATDPAVYPEGKVTGYFGPLTKEAIKRLQKRHELEVTGVIDEATHDLLESYLKERFGEQIPPGLLRAPGIAKKIEIRIKEGCDNSGKGKALFCEKLKIKYKGDEDSDDDSDEDEDNDSDEFEVEVETEHGSTTVSFTFEGEDYSLELDSTNVSDVLEAVADALDTTVGNLDRDLKNEIKEELADELADDEDEDSDDDSDDEDEDEDSDDDSDDEDEDD